MIKSSLPKGIKLFLFFALIGITSTAHGESFLWKKLEVLKIFGYFPAQSNPVTSGNKTPSLEE